MSKPQLSETRVGVVVECVLCGRPKAPVGRSVPPEMYLCDHRCNGYAQPPLSGSLWPGESEATFDYPVNADGTTEASR